MKKLIKPIILIVCVLILAYGLKNMQGLRARTVYGDHLDDVAVTVDGNEVTFRDLAFYILYEERVVEEQARIYNPDSTKDYWNLHTNDSFIQMEAKDVIMGMAVHDQLFYELAVENQMDTLTEDEERELAFSQTDFWEDLLDIQWKKLPCDEDTINAQIRKAAIAEKYQNYLAERDGPSQAAYKYDGYYYEQIEKEHDIEINDRLWDNFVVGDITLVHQSVNYINGLTDEDKETGKD